MCRWFASSSLLLLAVSSCDRETDEAKTPAASASVSSVRPTASLTRGLAGGEVVFEAPLGGRTAFDMVVSGSGVLLVASQGDGIVAQELDAVGAPVRRQTLAPAVGGGEASVAEIAATRRGGRAAVAWVLDSGSAASAHVALGQLSDLSFDKPIDLGAATLATTERGHVTVAAIGGDEGRSGSERFVVFHRGPKEPCDDDPRGCTTFPLHQVDATGATPRRVVLSVPAPCGRGVAGFVTAGDRWYYGVCALSEGRAATTMFTIEHSPEYAQAESVLPGCIPIGTTAVDGEAVLVGRCGRERRAVRLGRREVVTARVQLDDVRVRCEADAPVIEFPGSDTVDVRMEAGRGDIAAILPVALAPTDARAVYTGKALLVAVGLPRKVIVRRYACQAAPP